MKRNQVKFIGYCLTAALLASLTLGVAACSSATSTANAQPPTIVSFSTAQPESVSPSMQISMPAFETSSVSSYEFAQTLSSIAIITSETPDSMLLGAAQQFSAIGTYSDGSTSDISSEVTWSSSDTSIVSIDSNGMATALTDGNVTISATLSGVTSPGVFVFVQDPSSNDSVDSPQS